MTQERRWERGSNAQDMVRCLAILGRTRTKAGRRKLRLFATGFSRQFWDFIPDNRIKRGVELSERYADGSESVQKLRQTSKKLLSLQGSGKFRETEEWHWIINQLAVHSCRPTAFETAYLATVFERLPIPPNVRALVKLQPSLLRCIFGNPFQKPAFNKKWRTETVTALAGGIYAEHAFDRLPILADALEEAGCDDPAMLTHLRGTGPHCRGCWVLDLALGK